MQRKHERLKCRSCIEKKKLSLDPSVTLSPRFLPSLMLNGHFPPKTLLFPSLGRCRDGLAMATPRNGTHLGRQVQPPRNIHTVTETSPVESVESNSKNNLLTHALSQFTDPLSVPIRFDLQKGPESGQVPRLSGEFKGRRGSNGSRTLTGEPCVSLV